VLIAEIGLAHDGSLGNALAFIDAVADAKARLIAKDDEPAKGQEGREPFGSVAKGKRGRCEV